MPTDRGSHLVVTSRASLVALHTHVAVQSVLVGPIDTADSFALLTAGFGGREPLRPDDPDVLGLLDLCAGMPLALRILAARLATEPWLTAGDLHAELSVTGTPLDGLAVEGDIRNVRSVLASAYAPLMEPERRALRLMAAHTGRLFKPELFAAMTGERAAVARRTLTSLATTNLVTEADGYYGMHDLVRRFAEERLCEHSSRDEAVRRMLDWYLAVTTNASRVLRPDRSAYQGYPLIESHIGRFARVKEAIDFLNGERENLRTSPLRRSTSTSTPPYG